MIRNPRDLVRYNASERANHWVVGICFILLALSGLAFFHPALFPLTQLFGGGAWTRILHPYIGVVMALSFLVMALRFAKLNIMEPRDYEWLKNVDKMIDGDDHNMPEQGKYNGGQKLLFWGGWWSAWRPSPSAACSCGVPGGHRRWTSCAWPRWCMPSLPWP